MTMRAVSTEKAIPYQLEKPMSFNEVREFLGRGNTWLYDQLQRGELPGHKIAGKWVVYPSELKKYLNRQYSNQKRIKRRV